MRARWVVGLFIIVGVCPVLSGASSHFPTLNMQLLSHMPLSSIGGSGSGILGNDIWGWTDSMTGREYALVGRTDGTAFVDVTDPVNPVYLGLLPTQTGTNIWRDVKVYADHAYVVAENNGNHGMQVFDLTQLRNVPSPPVVFSNTTLYSGFTESHNIVINEDSGYAYSVGDNTFSGGMHFIDLTNPAAPVAAGGYSGDGYTHDAQVVNYNGPDLTYQGREIAFNSNEDTVTIVDVTDKLSPVMISRTGYPNAHYVHQGWLTEDHAYFLSNDELDERDNPAVNFTRTHIWDMADLASPLYMGFYEAAVQSIDHNLYTHNGLVFAANYTTGLRVLDSSDIANGNLTEIAYIDTHPAIDSLSSFSGAWSVYPYFSSGTIIIGDRQEGLVVVRLSSADLSVSAGVSVDPVVQGFDFDYQLTVFNLGIDDTNNTMLTADLPLGVSYIASLPTQGSCSEVGGTVTCNFGTVADAASASVDITVTAASPGNPSINVTVTAEETDPVAANNQVSIATTVLPDTDGDGLSDAFEMLIGTSITLVDTDGDGVSDFDEVAYDGDSSTYIPGVDLNPNLADTDGDGVNDLLDPFPLVPADGDINDDGSVNILDLLLIHRHLLGEISLASEQIGRADVAPLSAGVPAPDGQIDLGDALVIQRKALGIISF